MQLVRSLSFGNSCNSIHFLVLFLQVRSQKLFSSFEFNFGYFQYNFDKLHWRKHQFLSIEHVTTLLILSIFAPWLKRNIILSGQVKKYLFAKIRVAIKKSTRQAGNPFLSKFLNYAYKLSFQRN